MESRARRLLPAICFLTVGLSGASLFAQEAAKPTPNTVGGSAVAPPSVRGVEGLPYSGVETTITTHVLADGTTITQEGRANVFRDSMGRTRREQFLQSGSSEKDKPLIYVIIRDPVAGVTYDLNPDDLTARKEDIAPRAAAPLPKAVTPAPEPRPKVEQLTISREDLGTQNIEGLDATGIRLTKTIPIGFIGNDRPIEEITEYWHSPELKVEVMMMYTTVFGVKTVVRLSNVSRDEPPAELFQVPANYTIEEMTPVPPNPAAQ